MGRIEGFLSRAVVRYRWWIIALAIPVTLIGFLGMSQLTITNDMRVFFGEDNPDYQALKALENTYNRRQSVLFVMAPQDGDVFTRKSLQAVVELTEAAWEMPYSLRVESIANFQNMRADGDDVVVEDLVSDPAELMEADVQRIRQTALSEGAIVRKLISPSGHVTTVYVAFTIPPGRRAAIPEITEAAERLTERFKAGYPAIDFHLTGSIIIDHAFGQASRQDLFTLSPLVFVVISVLAGLALRTLFGTLAAVAVILLSMAAALGLAGWVGVPLNAVSVGAPGLILTLAVADSVHLLAGMIYRMRGGLDRREAVAESVRVNLQAVSLTSGTTIIGFLGMNLSESPPFRDLGNIVAIGVAVAFLCSILLLPALMCVLPVTARPTSVHRIRRGCDRLADLTVRYREPVFWSMLVVAVGTSLGISRIELNDNFLKYFDQSFRFRRATDFMIEHIGGWDAIEYPLPSGQTGGAMDPAYLAAVDRFAEWYRRQPKVVHVHSIADTIKRINRGMHGGDPSRYRIPDDREAAAQYLLFYELSLPFGRDLNDQIDVDRSASRMIVTFESLSARELREMDAKANEWMRANLPASMFAPGTGLSLTWARITQRNIASMLKGLFGALVLISAIMILALRSLKLGLISLVPNLLPPLMAFGIWGLLVGRVGLALSVIVAMTIGIVVDDTIHFLSRYRRARLEGMTAEQAIHHAFQTVGTAMWITTVALVAGFSVLSLSHYRMSAEMGLMCALTITLALVMDFLLLPTLLLKIDRLAGRLSDQ